MNKRAQAALEFLMTYGWAILVVLVVIGALAYFGVLNPSGLLPEKCTMSAGIACQDHLIDPTTGEVSLSFENGFGSGIYINTIEINGAGNNYFASGAGCTETFASADCDIDLVSDIDGCTFGDAASGELYHIDNGGSATITIGGATACDITDFGGKAKVDITITYYADDSSSTFMHTITGELLAAAEAS